MRLLDRYFLGLFLGAAAVFLAAFLFLLVIVDFVSRVDDFLALENLSIPLFIAEFYLYRLPLFLVFLLPVATLFAAMFTMTRAAASNEVVPILVSGVSIRRIVRPFLIAALLAGAVMAAIDEWVLPAVSSKIAETEGIVRGERMTSNVVVRDGQGKHLFVTRYEAVGRVMEDIVVSVVGAGGWIEELIIAREGVWSDREKCWRLSGGRVYRYREGLDRRVVPIDSGGLPLESDLQPADLSRSKSLGSGDLAFAELLRLCGQYPANPFLRTQLHLKCAMPLTGLLLMLLGLPFVIRSESRSLYRGLFLCLAITLLYYAVHFFLLDLGRRGLVLPPAAVWIPVVAFGGIGTLLFIDMKS
ncbi:MAG: hypothetical protein A2Z34_04695 [Planctomycetes bacterium RBG_16_59_8]|nr:MAG: hypothetical protein A2Z34_04695 [Planctomycetes bacterium RBG_16_59_8]